MITESQIIAIFLGIFALMVGGSFLYNLFTTPVILYRLIDIIVILILIIWGLVYSVTMGRP
jgi:hypothetical protein